MSFVVDASMVLAWLLPDEGNKDSDQLLDRWMNGEEIFAPELIRYEVSNAIVMAAIRKHRITPEEMEIKLREFDALTIELDPFSGKQVSTAATLLATEHDLSIYDAAYLELAIRRQLPLATLDKYLGRASQAEKLPAL